MDAPVLNLHSLFDNLRSHVDILNESIEPQFIQMALNFEDCRRRWLRFEQDLGSCKEVLAKAETERGALEVKLKHARNQVDVEIRRRQKAEANCEKLDCQIQLIWELLITEGSSNSLQLNEEQRSALAFLNAQSQAARANLNTRKNESASILSDISYDKTDDSLVNDNVLYTLHDQNNVDTCSLNLSTLLPRSWKHRMSCAVVLRFPFTGTKGPSPNHGKTAPDHYSSFTKLYIWHYAFRQAENVGSYFRVKSFILPHAQVFKPESCVPCGMRIKFGKISLKCRDCRLVTHPECRERCPLGKFHYYVSHVQSPMIPSLVVHCVNEIEQRGLHETGLYRLSGSDLTVKELKEKLLRGKTVPLLSKVEDIHCITGLLKDLFQCSFMLVDEDNSIALMYQTISDLPQANRATLAFMAIHLQRVTQSLDTKMDIPNLARVFGPTIVGHAVPDPEPMTTIQDTKRQPKVIERLLGLPVEYWSQFMMVDLDHLVTNCGNMTNVDCVNIVQVSMLGPLTTPEHHQMNKTPSSSSLGQRMRSTLSKTTFGSKSRSAVVVGFPSRPGNFFASPLLK
uniref:Rac GTPase activating protein 1 n=1 Tax=Oncorhynchus mykiss TaxID=8022 RepID=A0A8C7RBF1_ONCMY